MRMADGENAVVESPLPTADDRAGDEPAGAADWPRAWRLYLVATVLGHFAWETLHLPLYTIWTSGSPRERAFAVVHCTGGDILIALTALALAIATVASPSWPARSHGRVLAVTIALGVGYTIFSEWLNIVVRESWAYSAWMPVVPIINTGLSPLLQWVVLPTLALLWARRAALAAARPRVRPLSRERKGGSP